MAVLPQDVRRKVVLVGFMGSGKSSAAPLAAALAGGEAVDVDEVLEQRLGRSIARVFDEDGEGRFREEEERLTLELLASQRAGVVALGGGAVLSASVRAALREHQVIWLDVDAETAWQRCREGHRPLAQDRRAFLRRYAEREPLYRQVASCTVVGDGARAVARVLPELDRLPPGSHLLWAGADASKVEGYPVYLGAGLLLREGFWPHGLDGRRFMVSDGHVARRYREVLRPLTGEVTVMPGEGSKTVAHAEIVWSELARGGMNRADLVVALGGGVVGDLAGFCAATYQRGVRYVQVPTTLVAQVDSAYGGKTAVDLPEAKNYVGAYHQPTAVLVDTETLGTLPPEELAAGFAEVIKTALIAGGELWERVRSGAPEPDLDLIRGCVHTKLRIVAQDQRDEGMRQVLNLGHTVGHAIETVTGYVRYRHGEAVALGLLAALRLSGQEALRQEVAELLEARGLPVRLQDADPDAVVMATARDKKRVGEGPVPFVLLEEPGSPRHGCQVQTRELIAAVRELASAPSSRS